MTTRVSGTRAFSVLLAALLTGACVSALQEPPEVSQITGGAAAQNADGDDVETLLARADEAFADASDIASVERARQLYLRALDAQPSPLEAYLGAARTTAWLVEKSDDSGRRETLATQGVQLGQLCQRQFPDAPECRYRLALAVGQQARERPSTAVDGLDVMVHMLEGLIAETPNLDSAGPQRVLALVLLRAPGWPSGPGDPEMALDHARAAVAAFPDYPPNQLVLGEALIDNHRMAEGRAVYRTGLTLAEKLAAEGYAEASDWIADARSALADTD